MPVPLYPLRFEPIFKSAIWGGTRLRPFLGYPPSGEPTGEAWLLSDVDGSESRVSNGPLAGQTLRELMAEYGEDLLGSLKPINGRFPLLVKLIDARHELSVQVHPNDEQARRHHPTAAGKTEAWVVLEANSQTSRIYAGFKENMTEDLFQAAMRNDTVPNTLHAFTPRRGDCIFLPAGTVHAIGADIVMFEVQQTSDITYRLFDWNRVDAKTGKPRELHIEKAVSCSNFSGGPNHPVRPREHRVGYESLVDCSFFALDRLTIACPLDFDAGNVCRILTIVSGHGMLNGDPLQPGETILLPADTRGHTIVPQGSLTLLYCSEGGSYLC
jgi:mannose-6-phosphate isomerase